MKTLKPSRGIGQQLVALLILGISAYIAVRLLLWLFPQELRQVWAWILQRT